MTVSDAELRAMVRDAIARLRPDEWLTEAAPHTPAPAAPAGPHPSHLRLVLLASGDADGACLIEPAVRCNHCGYCQSYGH
jgi:hypothetical protein